MGIAISAGAGLLLGLGLLIWGLRERSKRHAAERAVDAAERLRDQAVETANHNAVHAAEMEDYAGRLNKAVELHRTRLAEVRELLAKHASIKTIRELLATEGEEEEI